MRARRGEAVRECCLQKLLAKVAPDGERYRCIVCGTRWQYVEDEAEGGGWEQIGTSRLRAREERKK